MIEYRLGDSHAFDELYNRHAAKVHGFIKRRLPAAQTSDAFQEVFLKLHRKRARYDSNYPFLPWLFAITRHTCIDWQRRAVRRESPVENVDLEVLSDPAEAIVNELIHQNDGALSFREREVLSLHFRDGFGFDEIGRRLQLSASNTRKISSRAVNKLKEIFSGK